MRNLAIVLFALVAIAAGGLWIFAEVGQPADPVAELAPQSEPLVPEPVAPAPSAVQAAPEARSAEPEPVRAEETTPAPEPKHELASKDAPPAPATAPAPPAVATTVPPGASLAPGQSTGLQAELESAARNIPGLSAQRTPPVVAEAAPPVGPAETPELRSAPAPVERRAQTARVAEAAPAEAAPSVLASEFRSRQVAYNRPPSKLVLGRPIDVSLVINATADEEAAREALEGFQGEIVERDVELSNIVSAQLTGVGFDIVSQSVERQKLSERTLNRWQWRITPTEPGTHTLILEIFGYQSGALEAEPLDAYRDEIVVEVRELDRIVNLAQRYQPVFAVVAGVAGALSALVALLRFRADRKKK